MKKPIKAIYTIRQIPKKTPGKYRNLIMPNKRTKRMQWEVLPYLTALHEHVALDCSHGFRPGRNPVTNASAHVGDWKYTLNMDLADFFPSVTPLHVVEGLVGDPNPAAREFTVRGTLDGFIKSNYKINYGPKYSKLADTTGVVRLKLEDLLTFGGNMWNLLDTVPWKVDGGDKYGGSLENFDFRVLYEVLFSSVSMRSLVDIARDNSTAIAMMSNVGPMLDVMILCFWSRKQAGYVDPVPPPTLENFVSDLRRRIDFRLGGPSRFGPMNVRDVMQYLFPGTSPTSVPSAHQGLPTSPVLANIAGTALDRYLCTYFKELIESKELVYTRYADDLSFSYNDPVLFQFLQSKVADACGIYDLDINPSKTHLQSSYGGRRRKVTGLMVDADGVHPSRRNKRRERFARHHKWCRIEAGLQEWNLCKKPDKTKVYCHEGVAATFAWRVAAKMKGSDTPQNPFTTGPRKSTVA